MGGCLVFFLTIIWPRRRLLTANFCRQRMAQACSSVLRANAFVCLAFTAWSFGKTTRMLRRAAAPKEQLRRKQHAPPAERW